ncbi:NIL domain-containing protein [Desulfothermus naphthae]
MNKKNIKKNVLLIFNKDVMYNPVIYKLAADFKIIFNVLEAKILPRQEGRLILQLIGTEEQIERGVNYLLDEGVKVEILADKIKRDEEVCVHCGACLAVCRSDALSYDSKSAKILFTPEHCVACGQCELVCPVGAVKTASIDMELT